MTGRRFIIEFRAREGQRASVPVESSLRNLLKVALRCFNLRCISIVEREELPEEALGRMSGGEKRRRICALEVENLSQASVIQDLEYELSAAVARERFLTLKLSQMKHGTAAGAVADENDDRRGVPAKEAV